MNEFLYEPNYNSNILYYYAIILYFILKNFKPHLVNG